MPKTEKATKTTPKSDSKSKGYYKLKVYKFKRPNGTISISYDFSFLKRLSGKEGVVYDPITAPKDFLAETTLPENPTANTIYELTEDNKFIEYVGAEE
jgi:hypothetical protein